MSGVITGSNGPLEALLVLWLHGRCFYLKANCGNSGRMPTRCSGDANVKP